MIKFGKIFNPELTIGSFVIRVLSVSLLALLTLISSIFFLISDTFSSIVLFTYNISMYISYSAYNVTLSLLETINITYIYKNKLLLSFILFSLLITLISYEIIRFTKESYRPYLKYKYTLFSMIEIFTSIYLFYILANNYILSWSINSLTLYDNLLKSFFISYCIILPIIIFFTFNKESLLLIKNIKLFKKHIFTIVREMNKALITEMGCLSFIFFIILFILLALSISILLINFSLLMYLSILLILIYTILYIDSKNYKKSIFMTNDASLELVKTYKRLLMIHNNDRNSLVRNLNIKNEKDFFVMYVKTSKTINGKLTTVHRYDYEYFDLNKKSIKIVHG